MPKTSPTRPSPHLGEGARSKDRRLIPRPVSASPTPTRRPKDTSYSDSAQTKVNEEEAWRRAEEQQEASMPRFPIMPRNAGHTRGTPIVRTVDDVARELTALQQSSAVEAQSTRKIIRELEERELATRKVLKEMGERDQSTREELDLLSRRIEKALADQEVNRMAQQQAVERTEQQLHQLNRAMSSSIERFEAQQQAHSAASQAIDERVQLLVKQLAVVTEHQVKERLQAAEDQKQMDQLYALHRSQEDLSSRLDMASMLHQLGSVDGSPVEKLNARVDDLEGCFDDLARAVIRLEASCDRLAWLPNATLAHCTMLDSICSRFMVSRES